MLRLALLTAIVAVVAGVVFYFWWGNRTTQTDDQPQEVTLSIWSIYQDEGTLKLITDEYTKLHPNVHFSYRYEPLINYRSRVATQIAANQGPDIFMIHNSWIGMFQQSNLLAALPENILSGSDYASTFYPIVKNSYTANNQIFGISQGVDGLGLYINLDILRESGGTLPKDWREFTDLAVKMSKYDEDGNIVRAGAAIGATKNIDYWSDILGLLMLQQPGADMTNPGAGNGPEVLNFYTDFVRNGSKRVWDEDMENSLNAFAKGKVGMIFGPASLINDLKTLSPKLRFVVTDTPQLPGKLGEDVNWGSFWGFAVSRNSVDKTVAWDFLRFLTSKEMEILAFNNSLQVAQIVGQPYSRVDLANELSQDTKLGAFVRQAPFYKNWYLNWGTGDKGWNDKVIDLYKQATDKVLQGADAKKSLDEISRQIQDVLKGN